MSDDRYEAAIDALRFLPEKPLSDADIDRIFEEAERAVQAEGERAVQRKRERLRQRVLWGTFALAAALVAILVVVRRPWAPVDAPGPSIARPHAPSPVHPSPAPSSTWPECLANRAPPGIHVRCEPGTVLQVDESSSDLLALSFPRRGATAARFEVDHPATGQASPRLEVVIDGLPIRHVGTEFVVRRGADGDVSVRVETGIVEVGEGAVAVRLEGGVSRVFNEESRRRIAVDFATCLTQAQDDHLEGRDTRSIRRLRRCVEYGPADAALAGVAGRYLGDLLRASGDHAGARAAYTHALRGARPDDRRAIEASLRAIDAGPRSSEEGGRQ